MIYVCYQIAFAGNVVIGMITVDLQIAQSFVDCYRAYKIKEVSDGTEWPFDPHHQSAI